MPHAAGIIVREPGGRLLFLKRGLEAPDHAEKWCWPGGGIDEGETPEQAARRELREETGHDFTGPLTQVDDRGGFVTFLGDVAAEFEPTLNDEHTDATWSEPDPRALSLFGGTEWQFIHPGTLATIEDLLLRSKMTADAALRRSDRLAFDRSSARRIDAATGHLHHSGSNISKEAVNPYYGREIPGWKELGLEAETIYNVYRPAAELEKAAASFAGKPLLIIHKPVKADDHPREVVVGAIGSNVEFKAPYLRADLVIWDGEAIAGVETDEQRELSSGYAYTPVLQEGEFEGQPYSIVMTNIHGNHVALVEEGRAGPDVLVGDAKPRGKPMKLQTKALPSRKALLVQGALSALLAPMLAADAKLDLTGALTGVNRENYKGQKRAIAGAVKTAVTGKLAQDEGLGEVVESVVELLDSLEGVQSGDADEDDLSADAEPEEDEKDKDKPKGLDAEEAGGKLKAAGMDEETCKKVMDALFGGAKDEDPDKKDPKAEDEEKVDKEAMDAAIRKAKDETRRDTIRDMNAIATAKAAVRPYVGDLEGAFDSAAEIYRLALDHAIENGADLDLTGVPTSAYGAMVKLLPVPGAAQPKRPTIAQDAKGATGFAERYAGAAAIKTL